MADARCAEYAKLNADCRRDRSHVLAQNLKLSVLTVQSSPPDE